MARVSDVRLNLIAHILAISAMIFLGLIVLGLGRPGVEANTVAVRSQLAF